MCETMSVTGFRGAVDQLGRLRAIREDLLIGASQDAVQTGTLRMNLTPGNYTLRIEWENDKPRGSAVELRSVKLRDSDYTPEIDPMTDPVYAGIVGAIEGKERERDTVWVPQQTAARATLTQVAAQLGGIGGPMLTDLPLLTPEQIAEFETDNPELMAQLEAILQSQIGIIGVDIEIGVLEGEIKDLEDRLLSRFEWGLVTDIQPPDFETRSAILRKKCEAATVRVPDDVLYFLAEKIRTNIRELEGALIRVVAYANLIGREITLDMAKEVLGKMLVEGAQKIDVDLIQKKVSEYYNIKPHDMRAKRRTKQLVLPRQVAMYLSRDLTNLSLSEIGAFFGGRDHTTILHAWEKINKDAQVNKATRLVIDRLISDIKGYR